MGGAGSFRPRVLIIAESCNPEWESIPLVGWSHYEALSRIADTYLVTRSRNRPALDRAGLVEGRDYTAIDTEALVRPMARAVEWISGPNKGWAMLTALSIPSYLLLEHEAWRRFGRGRQAGRFDIIHRLTPLSPAVPSLIAARCRRAGIPFVLGPINGGLPWPKEYPSLQTREGEWISRFRGLYKYMPWARSTRRDAAAIMVGGRSALRDLDRKWRDRAVYVPENGIDPTRFPDAPTRTAQSYAARPLHVVFLGRLVPYKGCNMLIEAIAPLLRAGRMTLEIIGFGPEEARLRAMVADEGCAGMVRFAGKTPHPELAGHLRQADILAFPSVHEFGGTVVLEAMAMGVVPIVVDYGGPAELTSPQTGYLLPLLPQQALVEALRQVLDAIVADPGQLGARSQAAMQRVKTLFTWDHKARQTLEVYRWVMGLRPTRPDWGMPLRDVQPEQGA
ncbi:glycosyltransferase family 4 protein [Komagataeibacter swingsii]|uniref:Glycosyl transferase family 1 n=1 Tax=Komagataeibacter swingsii TaxID=215220 RepID=A0A2V4R413_9PROT|nr:glycosyltransferase family 4 protein [Komagataeibacter swingsii]PYD69483.1 glycosyl transferase family 1 [Komagataeibacter swingsii]GBQ59568.1 glycosyltransferase [Komagataeibacter swingsii DSM 16373]